MSNSIQRLAEKVRQCSSESEQEAVASKLADQCRQSPEKLGRETRCVFRALKATSGETRKTLSGALFDLGKENREAVEHITQDIASLLHRESLCNQVRIDLGRALGEGVAGDPTTVAAGGVEPIVKMLDDDEKWFRQSIAWAVEVLAFARPVEAVRHPETIQQHVTDDHPPTAKHSCRALAHLERCSPGLSEDSVHDLCDNLHAEESSLRTAASITLGAVGSQTAVEALTGRYQIEKDSSVQRNIRHAIREARWPNRYDEGTNLSLADISEGDWLTIRPEASFPRTGNYRGKVTEIVSAAGVESPRGLKLENPYEGYGLSISTKEAVMRGAYADCRTSDPLKFSVADIQGLSDNLVELLYAIEGDSLEFDLDGPEFELFVTDVKADDTSHRVIGTGDSGNTVEFRPCSPDPFLARFHEGRCFEAKTVDLKPAEQSNSGSVDTNGRE